MENDFVFDLRTKIIKQIIDTKFERIEAASKANLLASLSSDISRLTEGFMRISELIQGAMIVLFCGIYVLYIAPMMFAFLFVWIGALMIFNRFLMKKVMQNYDLYRQNEDVLYKNYAAAIEGHKELSLSLAKAKSLYENDFLPNAQNLRQSSLRAEVYGAFASNFMNVMMLGAVGFVLYFGLSGGKAELFLTDDKDVLHAGVEIEVQLPTKKRQNLSVLSGGERALTVIALLFSFLRYRPAPFSVLDEIDAPLDEANVARFGKFLGEFAENTQFIVVTHRKGTMEAADFMYGITIEDAGVSRVLSVRLDEAIGGAR